MTQDESTLQELSARLAREEQVNADLSAKLANLQKDRAEQQPLAPAPLLPNQVTEIASEASQSTSTQQSGQEMRPTQPAQEFFSVPRQMSSLPAQHNWRQGNSPDAYGRINPSFLSANPSLPPPGYAYPPQPPYFLVQRNDPGSGLAVAGMILGIISLVLWLFYGIGIITSIVGLILSILGRRSVSRRGIATSGLVMSIIALVLSLSVCSFLFYFVTHIVPQNPY